MGTTIFDVACSGASPSSVASRAAPAILRDGVVCLRGAFGNACIEGWKSRIESYLLPAVKSDRYPYRIDKLDFLRDHFTLEIHREFNSRDFYANPFVYQLARLLLEQDFIMMAAAVAYAEPGATKQRIHRDQPLMFHGERANAQMPPVSLTVGIPLVATDSETGGTEFLPGTHRQVEPVTQGKLFVSTHTSPGDCCIWDSRTFHRGRRNGALARPMILLYYQRPSFFNFKNYSPKADIKITDVSLAAVPDAYRHLFDWNRMIAAAPQFSALDNGRCSCGTGELFSSCHGAP